MAISLLLAFNPGVAAKDSKGSCAGTKTSIIKGDICKGASKDAGKNIEKNAIWVILSWTVRVMTIGVGVAAVGGYIYGGILYSSAGDSPEQVKKATKVLVNTTIGLLLFGVMFGVLNFLVPGGVFS